MWWKGEKDRDITAVVRLAKKRFKARNSGWTPDTCFVNVATLKSIRKPEVLGIKFVAGKNIMPNYFWFCKTTPPGAVPSVQEPLEDAEQENTYTDTNEEDSGTTKQLGLF